MLSKESLAKIDRELTKYPAEQKRSALMSALRIAQLEHGWLSNDVVEAVADYLGLPPIAAMEVATFYGMFNRQPVGKFKLTVCTNLPCALSGGADAGKYLQQKLGIGYGETTADGKFTLQEGECMGACGYAPVMLFNNHTMCNHMTPEAIDKKLAELE
ncbi:NADH-quinone oxidoreductase subunit NuoE [Amantichitinum ursilacus]|uniref:NADH-quinone oxidoreductase subunit 2 n=1 Tax=Amantichitinum ursilacus TaxID=857265 RepID=A0A0N0XKV2_9NEIS|nr:NADH-quinone oxidoreductase subunit NuoE [Amantichitinum ursilacus]KPC54549.1 NADH-quinone oxidoreductase subunit 2 [Amantichitinum ursilacus]